MTTASLHPGLKKLNKVGYHSFDNALKSGESIWVVNNSQPKSLLILTISDPLSGKPKALEFYRTIIPFCLTDMLPHSLLEQSLEIRNFIRKGILKLISEDEAHAILASEDGQREYQRLETSPFAVGSAITPRVAEMIESTSYGRQTAGENELDAAINAKPELQIHSKLKILENRSLAGELDVAGLLSELRIYSSEFTEVDCNYIVTHQFPEEAREFARKKITAKEFAAEAPQATKIEAKSYKFDDSNYKADYEF